MGHDISKYIPGKKKSLIKMFKVRITSFCDFLVIRETQKQTGTFLQIFLFGSLEIFACIWDRPPKINSEKQNGF